MSEHTNIQWTDSTFNPWWGCNQVSPGCDNCYAKTLDERYKGGAHWNNGEHYLLSESNWKKPISWNRAAAKAGVRRRVFCASMADVFDNQADPALRERLWATIRQTPNLDWMLLTKRAPNIKRFLPSDWGNGYPNVWLGVSVENIKHGVPRIDILRKIPATVRFLSCEPLLEDLGPLNLDGIHWAIIGGESGFGFRPMNPQWAQSIIEQCNAAGVVPFFKQTGGFKGGGDVLNGRRYQSFPLVPEVAK